LPQWAKTKAIRTYGDGIGFKGTSILTIATNYTKNKETKAAYNRNSSIKTAQSNAIISRTENQKTVKKFESKRDTTGIKVQPLSKSKSQKLDLKKDVLAQLKSTKTRPVISANSFCC